MRCGGNPNGLYAAEFTPPVLPSMPGQPVVKPASYAVTSFMTNGQRLLRIGRNSDLSATDGEILFGQVAEGKGDASGGQL